MFLLCAVSTLLLVIFLPLREPHVELVGQVFQSLSGCLPVLGAQWHRLCASRDGPPLRQTVSLTQQGLICLRRTQGPLAPDKHLSVGSLPLSALRVAAARSFVRCSLGSSSSLALGSGAWRALNCDLIDDTQGMIVLADRLQHAACLLCRLASCRA